MNRKLIGGVLALGLLIPATALAQESVLLRLKPKVGAVYVYNSVQETSMSGIGKPSTQKSTLTLTMKVVDSNARAVKLQSSLSNITGNNADIQDLKTFRMTSTLSPLFKILDLKSSGGGPSGAQIGKGMEMAMKLSPSFPTKPIRVRDSWQMNLDFSEVLKAFELSEVKFIGDSSLNLKVVLAKIEKRGSKTLAHIRMTGYDKLTMEARSERVTMDLSLNCTLVIDVATGMYVSSDVTIDEKMKVPTGNILIKMRSTSTRVKGP